nr:hypothetical protein [Candidatus Baldrarchaeota archaeon]
MSGDSRTRFRQGLFALLSGVSMLVGGFRGRAGGLLTLVREATEVGVLPVEVSRFIGGIVVWLAILGGVTVIFGGFLHFIKAPRFIANFFVSVGSGVSVFNLVSTLIASGPTVKLAILKASFTELLNIGVDFAMLVLASVFAFFALINDPLGFILGMIAGLSVNFSSSLAEFKAISMILNTLGISVPSSPLIVNILVFLFFSGVFFFVAGLLYGYNFYRVGLLFFTIGVIFLFPILFALILGFVFNVINVIRLIFGLVSAVFAIVGMVYGIVKVMRKRKRG